MRIGIVLGLLTCLLFAGCGSSKNNSSPDAPPITYSNDYPTKSEVDAAPSETTISPDGGCDDDVMGEDYCIKNPGTNAGNPSRVTRIPLQQCW